MKKILLCVLACLIVIACVLIFTHEQAVNMAANLPMPVRTAVVVTSAPKTTPEPLASALQSPAKSAETPGTTVIKPGLPVKKITPSPKTVSTDMPDVILLEDNTCIQSSGFWENNDYIFLNMADSYAIEKNTGKITKKPAVLITEAGGSLLYSNCDPVSRKSEITREDRDGSVRTIDTEPELCGLFAYQNKLYFSTGYEKPGLYRENPDGSGKEAVLKDVQNIKLYKGLAYCCGTKGIVITETDLTTGKVLRAFSVPDAGLHAPEYCVSCDRLFVHCGKDGEAETAVVDLKTGSATAAFVAGEGMQPYGQYVFYSIAEQKNGKTVWALKAYDARTGKCYYASDFPEVPGNLRMEALFATPKGLYIGVCTEKELYLYRVEISGGRAKALLTAHGKLPE